MEDHMNSRKICTLRGKDFISALPDSLIETILLKLPLRDAARSCILSTRWRQSWVKLPELKLDSEVLEKSFQTQNHIGCRAKFAMIISQILSLHQGPITDFKLQIDQLNGSPEVDSLIKYISRYEIKTFYVQMSHKEKYKLPSSIFSCSSLIRLCLWNCEIPRLPSTFTGFNWLIELLLITVTVSAQQLRYIVSNSPALRTLILRTTVDILNLGIKSPSLRSLAVLSYPRTSNVGQQEESTMSISKFLGGIPGLQILVTDGCSIQSLFVGGIQTRLQTLAAHLKQLYLFSIDLGEVDQLSRVLCLLRSTPALKQFVLKGIKSNSRTINNIQEEDDYSDIALRSLEIVRMESAGGRSEMQLIKLLLAKSPSLRKMTIELASSKLGDNGLNFCKEMLMFKRVAPNVEVHIQNGASCTADIAREVY